ncbi:ABC transporter substrate-binding protein [Vibrio parahaemolyticus]|uniref:ABC transporter substrate-binding protein n=1 Tax=Vibrio parahaemolyticus TaxID=670 RepID=UPI00226ADAFA|nr:hypothetical protein [Vibrio parahaemolyticus]MCX8905844.1 hypothetical protein [Vibrio parahaemolyticus]
MFCFKNLHYLLASCLYLTAVHLHAQTIAIIDSYHYEYPWANSERKGFEEHIDPSYQLTYYEMDTKRIAKSQFSKRAEQLWEAAIGDAPDMFVTMDDNALKYLGQRVSDAGYHLVFMGVNNDPRAYFENHQLPQKVVSILERPLIKQNISLIAKLVTIKAKRVLLMMDGGTTANSIATQMLGGSRELDVNNIALEVFTTNNYSEWQDKVLSISPLKYDALIIGSYASLKDNSSKQVPDTVSSQWTSSHSTVPLFSFWQHGIGKGKALGGLAVSGFEQGAKAADAVNAILTSGKVPFVEVPQHGEFILSEAELIRWGIELPHYLRRRSVLVE